MSSSREYAKFKREFVGPLLTRKQRIALSPAMPCLKTDISLFYIKPTIIEKRVLTEEELIITKQQGIWSAYSVERQQKREGTMPPWANKEAIISFYIESKRLTLETGIKHEVDHIIPLNNPIVCGLHVEHNLQILTKYDNIKKSNTFKVE